MLGNNDCYNCIFIFFLFSFSLVQTEPGPRWCKLRHKTLIIDVKNQVVEVHTPMDPQL